MITLDDGQWQELLRRETSEFVAAVAAQYLALPSQASVSPLDEQALRATMAAAFDYATRAGFITTPSILRLMYLIADAPGLLADPVFDAYLCKPGASPERRLDDLLSVVKFKLREGG